MQALDGQGPWCEALLANTVGASPGQSQATRAEWTGQTALSERATNKIADQTGRHDADSDTATSTSFRRHRRLGAAGMWYSSLLLFVHRSRSGAYKSLGQS